MSTARLIPAAVAVAAVCLIVVMSSDRRPGGFVIRPHRDQAAQATRTPTLPLPGGPPLDEEPVAPSAVSSVTCICGPTSVESGTDRGCQVVVNNAVVVVRTNRTLELRLIETSEVRFLETAAAIIQCIGHPEHDPPRIVWNFDALRMGRATEAQVRQCHSTGWDPSLLWVVEWPTPVFYHFMFDHGVLQAWMFLRELERVVSPMPKIHVHLMHMTEWVKSHVTAAERELWKLMVGDHLTEPVNASYCQRHVTFGFWRTSPMLFHAHYRLDAAVRTAVTDFSFAVQKRLIDLYGDRDVSPHLALNVPRPFLPSYDDQHRSRGVHPTLDAAIKDTLRAVGAKQVVTTDFESLLTLKAQFHTVRRHRLVYAPEGSFFVSMIFAPPHSTWVQVYNHTKAANDWKHHGFHATIASALPFMRLVVFVVDHGRVPPQEELRQVLLMPWAPGVVFVGANANGNAEG